MYKNICGFCPVQEKEYSISVYYIDASTMEERKYIKGRATCDYTKYGNVCNVPNCPIIEKAPERI